MFVYIKQLRTILNEETGDMNRMRGRRLRRRKRRRRRGMRQRERERERERERQKLETVTIRMQMGNYNLISKSYRKHDTVIQFKW
jgi:hypothetical protein